MSRSFILFYRQAPNGVGHKCGTWPVAMANTRTDIKALQDTKHVLLYTLLAVDLQDWAKIMAMAIV